MYVRVRDDSFLLAPVGMAAFLTLSEVAAPACLTWGGINDKVWSTPALSLVASATRSLTRLFRVLASRSVPELF